MIFPSASGRPLLTKTRWPALVVAALLALLGAFPARATTGVDWTARTGIAAPWRALTYGNGLFVATGSGSTLMTSPDGVVWTSRTFPLSTWYGVTYAAGQFVAVGASSTATSPDGVTWTSRTVPSNNWYGVAYGAGLFVAVASGGGVMTSPDGVTWTSRTPASGGGWQSVTYAAGLFVAVGVSGVVMTSPDGISWTSRTSALSSTCYGVTYAAGLFVAVGTNGAVMTSPDGTTWTSRSGLASSWRSVTYGNGLFVAVAYAGTGPRVMTSPDGVTWTARTAPAATTWMGVAYGNGRFVSVSFDGTSRVMTSGSDCGDGLAYTAGDWRQFATPCAASASPASVASVLGNAPTANLSAATYNAQWALYGRNATNSGNTLLTSSDTLGSGAGYWIKSFSAPLNGKLTVAGAAAAPTTGVSGCQSLVGCVVVAVGSTTAGSRMLGNPFGYDIPWSQVRIRVGGASGTVYTPTAADAAGYVSKQIWIWNGSSYDTWDDATTPGNLKYSQSFFMKVLTGGAGQTIELLIPVNSTI
ncbi:hypothetical protein WOC76_23695 [Methylocystis sp. IM3]|uniref:WD40/YVTN/BNR-like repeat-containing protein n=1 Tax=unclassified Methylocystis TaxID=2625913 RepID=UPI00311A5205